MKLLGTVVVLLSLIIVHLAGTNACAEDLKVHFAGFAFRGDQVELAKNYPYSLQISKEVQNQRGVLDVALAEKIKNISIKNGQIITGELANLGDGSLTLACCLDMEQVSVERYDDGFKIVIDLGAQALFFDYDKMQVVATYPIVVELIDFVPQRPHSDLIKSRIRDLLLTDKYGVNLFDDFTHILQQVELKPHYGGALQVTKVIVEDKALAELSDKFKGNIDNFKAFVAQNFGKYLSKNQGAAILPYTKGSDIGGKMAVQFSDAKVFELEVPGPQFAIEITVRGFKKVCTEEKAAGSCWVYGAYTNININQPALGKVYLDEKFKYAVSKIVSADQQTINDWPSYQNSLIALFNNITKQFGEESKYKKVREVLKKCS